MLIYKEQIRQSAERHLQVSAINLYIHPTITEQIVILNINHYISGIHTTTVNTRQDRCNLTNNR
jgi:hypothetical protein